MLALFLERDILLIVRGWGENKIKTDFYPSFYLINQLFPVRQTVLKVRHYLLLGDTRNMNLKKYL